MTKEQRREQLDTEWQHLQFIEANLLGVLGDHEIENQQHDLFFARLGEIRQRMTEIMTELEQGSDWAVNGCGDE